VVGDRRNLRAARSNGWRRLSLEVVKGVGFMFRKFSFPLRCTALANWIQTRYSFADEACSGDRTGSQAGVWVAYRSLHPESAIKCAVLNRFTYMLG